MPMILIGGLIRTNFLQSEGSSEPIVRGDNRNQLPSPSHSISHPVHPGSPFRGREGGVVSYGRFLKKIPAFISQTGRPGAEGGKKLKKTRVKSLVLVGTPAYYRNRCLLRVNRCQLS